MTATGAFVGTLDYVAPEQIRGDRVDARADVYALGCVLFELLAGIPPFASREDKVAKMYAHLNEEPTRLRVLRPELPAAVDAVAARALAKDPAERFPSAGDLGRAVSAAVEGEPTEGLRAQRRHRRRRPRPAGRDDDGRRRAGRARGRHRAGGLRRRPLRRRAPAGEVERPRPAPTQRVLFAGGAAAVAAAVVAVILIPTGGGDDGGGTSGLPPPATLTTARRRRHVQPRRRSRRRRCRSASCRSTSPTDGAGSGSRTAGSDTVSLVDGGSANEVAEFAAGSSPEGIDVGDGSIWVASAADDELLRLDPTVGRGL